MGRVPQLHRWGSSRAEAEPAGKGENTWSHAVSHSVSTSRGPTVCRLLQLQEQANTTFCPVKPTPSGETGTGANPSRTHCAGTCRDGKHCGGRVSEVGSGKGRRAGTSATETPKGREGAGPAPLRLRAGSQTGHVAALQSPIFTPLFLCLSFLTCNTDNNTYVGRQQKAE